MESVTNPIKQLLESYGDNDGFFNPLKLLPHFDDTILFYIVGARRIGKTDLFLRLACDLWLQFSRKTLWIRDHDKHFQDDAFISAFLADAKLFGWCPENWITKKDGVWTSDKDGELVIKFQGVNTFSSLRGGAHPDVDLFVQDEFMPENGRYPPHCATGLMSLSKTVLNGRENARIFCLSNYTRPFNPYYAKFRIIPDGDKEITTFPDKAILIQQCRGYRCTILQDGLWSKLYTAGNYGDYESAAEFSILSLLHPVPRGSKALPFFLYSDGLQYRGWSKDGLIYWSRSNDPTNGLDVFALDSSEIDVKRPLIPKWLMKQMKEASDANVYRYQDANVMMAIMTLFFSDL